MDVTWQAAVDWAKKQGHSLPTRAEQALLFANLKDQFEPRYYWSERAGRPLLTRGFSISTMATRTTASSSYEGRARAVRRLEI